MLPTNIAPSPDLVAMHAEWEALHTKLRGRERLLSDAVASYARGQGPRPDRLMEEVEAMRAECSVRFRALMAAVKQLQ